MAKTVKKAKKVKRPAVPARFIHIRNIPLADREMLFELKEIFGYKQNPKNLVRAAHKFLELRKAVDQLQGEVGSLNDKIVQLEEQKKDLASEFVEVMNMEAERDKLSTKIDDRKKALVRKYRAQANASGRGVHYTFAGE